MSGFHLFRRLLRITAFFKDNFVLYLLVSDGAGMALLKLVGEFWSSCFLDLTD